MSNAHFSMISEWITNGDIIEFVKANPDANRLKLCRFFIQKPISSRSIRLLMFKPLI